MLDELTEVKYLKEMKDLKSLQVKAEAYLGCPGNCPRGKFYPGYG